MSAKDAEYWAREAEAWMSENFGSGYDVQPVGGVVVVGLDGTMYYKHEVKQLANSLKKAGFTVKEVVTEGNRFAPLIRVEATEERLTEDDRRGET